MELSSHCLLIDVIQLLMGGVVLQSEEIAIIDGILNLTGYDRLSMD